MGLKYRREKKEMMKVFTEKKGIRSSRKGRKEINGRITVLILQVSLLFKQITFLVHTFYLICFYIYITINLNHIKYTTPHQIQKPLI